MTAPSPHRIVELQVNDENEINWDVLAGGWSSVRSPQWLRSKWWTIKRQVSNHKELPLAGTRSTPATLLGVRIPLSVGRLFSLPRTRLTAVHLHLHLLTLFISFCAK